MSKKIYLSPSPQKDNAYAVGNTTEMIQCNLIADAAKAALVRCGFEVKKAPQGQKMNTSIAESNSWKADLHIPIHTNAYNGKSDGTLVMVYATAQRNLMAARPIYNHVFNIAPGKTVRAIQARPDLAELNSTNALAVYVEAEFHDNPPIAQWIIDNTKSIGEALTAGVCEYYGVNYVKVPDENPGNSNNSNGSSDKLYKVQVGAFSVKQNAEDLAKKLNIAGYSTYIVLEKDMPYRVQTGAFKIRDNAVELSEKLKKDGFDSFIVQV